MVDNLKFDFKQVNSRLKSFCNNRYALDISSTYLMLVLSIVFALNHVNFRFPKTYWNLLLPIPIAILIPVKTKEKKELQERIKLNNSLLESKLVCKGCKYYHGQIYEQKILVCAIHPEGLKTDCPDYEK